VADPYILPVSTDAVGLATTGQATLQSMSATRYLRFWTTDRRSNVPAAVSANLVGWMQLPDALPIMPSWANTIGDDHLGAGRTGHGQRLGIVLHH
jgi:hypothetical protein